MAIFALMALVKGTELTAELTAPVMKLTTVIFIVFLLLNVEALIIKAVDIARNKYKAFLSESDTPFADTLAFNLIALGVFALIGTEGIINLIARVISYLD
jgi:hypothetical protein